MPVAFKSNYSWLLGPGDSMQQDYSSPTRVKNWLQANSITINSTDKQIAYGQWIAQLLQSQLGVELASLYYKENQTAWPFTLRDDVITEFDDYFGANEEQSLTMRAKSPRGPHGRKK